MWIRQLNYYDFECSSCSNSLYCTFCPGVNYSENTNPFIPSWQVLQDSISVFAPKVRAQNFTPRHQLGQYQSLFRLKLYHARQDFMFYLSNKNSFKISFCPGVNYSENTNPFIPAKSLCKSAKILKEFLLER